MRNAAVVTLMALTIQNAMALLLALACDRDIRFGGIYRVIFYLPPALSGLLVGLTSQGVEKEDASNIPPLCTIKSSKNF